MRTALITGGAGGVGRATAAALLAAGDAVVLADVDAARLEAAAEALAAPGRVRTVAADLRRVADCERAVGDAAAWRGRLDVLVCAAGLWTEGPSQEVTEDQWDRVIDVNLKGTFFVCRFAIPHLPDGDGCIVNLSSDAGLVGNAGAAVYCASKGGVTLLTRALAIELAERGVRAVAICPGDIDTPMLDFQAREFGGGDPEAYRRRLLGAYPQRARARFLRPEEVAALVVFATRPDMAGLTGAALSIDFGLTAGY